MSNNLRKKALLPAIAMVLVSVIALSGVTYAWFTTSNTATVSDLQVNVQSANGIQISLDGLDWKSSFNADDILATTAEDYTSYRDNVNQYPDATDKIYPVSTIGAIDQSTGLMKMFLGELTETNALQTTALEDGKNGNYIAFDLFFKVNSEDGKVISLDKTGSKVEDGISTIKSSLSSRVAFVNYGASDDATKAQGDKSVDSVVIWEPNATTHLDGTVSNGPLTYRGVSAISPDALTDENALGAVNPTPIDFANADNTDLFKLEKGINKVRIYIWMEGQDDDCINDASGGKLVTNLKFSQPADETTAA